MAPRRIRDYFKRYQNGFAVGIVCLIVTQGFQLALPRLLKQATDGLIEGQSALVQHAAMLMLIFAVGSACARIASRVLIFNAGREVEYDIRNDSYAHLLKLDPSFYGRMPVGQVMSRMVNDLSQVRLLLGPGLLNLTNTSLVYLVVIPLLFYTDSQLALLTLSPFPVLVFLGRLFGKRMYMLNRIGQEKLGELTGKVQENLSGAVTLRAYGQESIELQKFQAFNEAYLEANMRMARLRGLMFPFMGLAGSASLLIILYFGGKKITDGTMTVGEFVEFNAYLGALTWPTLALGWMISLWQRGLSSMARLNEIFAESSKVTEGERPLSFTNGCLEVRNLDYRYAEAAHNALTEINLSIKHGETVVVVGTTGSGKSTLLKLLARLLPTDDGTIFFDDQDVNAVSVRSVRQQIAFAPQEAFLFSKTIQENIAFGNPSATDQQVERATDVSDFTEEIAGFRDGLHTIVGERGVTLSGGQRQRSTLARAILMERPFLLLDDTLSAVDTETEAEILAALSRSRKKQTRIISTHRLGLADRADRIIVLDRGRIAEQGTEQELLKREGLYHGMYQRQRLRSSLEQRAENRTGNEGHAP